MSEADFNHSESRREALPITRRSFVAGSAILAAGACVPSSLRGQTDYPQPLKNPYPYTGVSGAGYPPDRASGHGGWRSGSDGVAYQGQHPYPFRTLPWKDYATGSAVTKGLLPAVQPLVDVQVRDTIVCRGGDGNFYLTGSTGENIWAYNRGVELWRSRTSSDGSTSAWSGTWIRKARGRRLGGRCTTSHAAPSGPRNSTFCAAITTFALVLRRLASRS